MKTLFSSASRVLAFLAVVSSAMTATPEDLVWSLNLKEMKTPNVSVRGHMPGCPDFKPDLVQGGEGQILFEQGFKHSIRHDLSSEDGSTGSLVVQPAGNNDRWSLTISLPNLHVSDGIEGKTFEQTPAKGKRDYNSPHIDLVWSLDNGSRSGNESFHGNFAMKLEMGSLTDGTIPAKICLCLPDEGKTRLAGTFKITGYEGKPLLLTKIRGKVETPPAMNEKALFIGSVWLNSQGKPETSGSYLRFSKDGELPRGSTLSSVGGFSVETLYAKGASFCFKDCLPGWHLVVVAAAEVKELPEVKRSDGFPSFGPRATFESLPRVYDCHWVELRDERSNVECNLSVDPARLGYAKIEVPDVRDGAIVSFLPVAPEAFTQASKLQGTGSALRAKVMDGTTGTISLPPGNYEFQCLGRTKTVTIERGKTVKVKLTTQA